MTSFVIDTELRRAPGESRHVDTTVTLSEKLGTDVIAVPAGGSLHLDLMLESVMDGILVTGTVSGTAEGECVRCLREVSEDVEVEITELFAYPDTLEDVTEDEDEEPIAVVEDDTIDLEATITDAFVLQLPLNPVCRADCEGLCPECGIELRTDPGHSHPEPIDPRWAALADLAGEDDGANED